jgi:hypothetical protein
VTSGPSSSSNSRPKPRKNRPPHSKMIDGAPFVSNPSNQSGCRFAAPPARGGCQIRAGIMRPHQRAERARIETQARKLAHSGRHGGWRSIERALMSRGGFSELAYVFANKWTRFELDRLCLQAQISDSQARQRAQGKPEAASGDSPIVRGVRRW